VRGWTWQKRGRRLKKDVSPACAGMDQPRCQHFSPVLRLPRVCGDGPSAKSTEKRS